jgi:secreted trypsin-like serine protease
MKNSGIDSIRGSWFGALGALALATGCVADAGDVESTTASTPEAIIGGSNAVAGGHPWIVFLYNNGPDATTCAGTLIHKDWVVTAAHCVDGGPGADGEVEPDDVFMYLGEFDRSGFGAPGEGGNWEQGKFASEVHIHHGYDPAASVPRHDIALVKLGTSALINARVKTIPLATATINSGTAIAAGWGATAPLNPIDEDALSSDILQRASLTVRPVATCNASEVGSIRQLFSDEMCAGDSDNSPGTCKGDSGGPLIRAKSGGGYELIGVTSWGSLYCTDYNVFSRVSSHLSWIRSYVPGV